jgi:hypothetical protein
VHHTGGGLVDDWNPSARRIRSTDSTRENGAERLGIDDGGPQRQAYVLLITLAGAAGVYAQFCEGPSPRVAG